MFFDYTLIISLILSALFLSISAWMKQDITVHTDKLHDFHKKFTLYRKIYYFFILTIFLTRLLYFVSFPQQIVDGFHFNSASGSFQIPLLITEGLFSLFYLLFMFFIHAAEEIKPPARKDYFNKVLFYFHLFILVDLSISLILYLQAGYYLILPAYTFKTTTFLPIISKQLSFILGLLLIFVYIAFWIVQKKRNKTGHFLFIFISLIAIGLALLAGIGNLPFFFDHLCYLKLFTYQNGFYAAVWLMLAYFAIVSQMAAMSVHSLKKLFINRYFALNVILQLNRITFLCVLGLIINSILPNILFSLI